jgi:hypothetical protein
MCLMCIAQCRQYCARRLRSLYKATKFLHGKGRYQKKRLELQHVTDGRCARVCVCVGGGGAGIGDPLLWRAVPAFG